MTTKIKAEDYYNSRKLISGDNDLSKRGISKHKQYSFGAVIRSVDTLIEKNPQLRDIIS